MRCETLRPSLIFPATVRPDGEQTDLPPSNSTDVNGLQEGSPCCLTKNQLLLTRYHSLGSLDRYFKYIVCRGDTDIDAGVIGRFEGGSDGELARECSYEWECDRGGVWQ